MQKNDKNVIYVMLICAIVMAVYERQKTRINYKGMLTLFFWIRRTKEWCMKRIDQKFDAWLVACPARAPLHARPRV